MSKERSVGLNSNVLDTDSHLPTKVGFYSEKNGLHADLVLEADNIYTITYPTPVFYSETSIIVKARGIFELHGSEPWLDDATVWYANKPEQSGGAFFITILEKTIVKNETTGDVTIVKFPPRLSRR